jgi:hypothetical protein
MIEGDGKSQFIAEVLRWPQLTRFLDSYPKAYWAKVTGAVLTIGIQTAEEKLPGSPTADQLMELAGRGSKRQDIKQKLELMKLEIENLSPTLKQLTDRPQRKQPSSSKSTPKKPPSGASLFKPKRGEARRPSPAGAQSVRHTSERKVPKYLKNVQSRISSAVHKDIAKHRQDVSVREESPNRRDSGWVEGPHVNEGLYEKVVRGKDLYEDRDMRLGDEGRFDDRKHSASRREAQRQRETEDNYDTFKKREDVEEKSRRLDTHHDARLYDGKSYAAPEDSEARPYGRTEARGRPEAREVKFYGMPEASEGKFYGKPEAKLYGRPEASEARPYGKPEASEAKLYERSESSEARLYGRPEASEARPYGRPEVSEAKPYGRSEPGEARLYGKPEHTEAKLYGRPETSEARSYGRPDISEVKPYGRSEPRETRLYDKPEHSEAKLYGRPEPSEGRPYGRPEISEAKLYGRSEPSEAKLYDKPEHSEAKLYGRPEASEAIPYGRPELSEGRPYGRPEDREGKPYGRSETGEAKLYGRPEAKLYDRPETSEARSYGRPEVSEALLYGKSEDSEASTYGRPEVSEAKPYGRPDINEVKPYGRPDPSEAKHYSKPKPYDTKAYGRPEVEARPQRTDAEAKELPYRRESTHDMYEDKYNLPRQLPSKAPQLLNRSNVTPLRQTGLNETGELLRIAEQFLTDPCMNQLYRSDSRLSIPSSPKNLDQWLSSKERLFDCFEALSPE